MVNRIINSLLDTDIYNLYIQQLVFHQFKGTLVKYKFKCRNKVIGNEINLDTFIVNVINEVDHFCGLQFLPDEIQYLRNQGVFQEDYLDFLKSFSPNRDHISIKRDGKDLSIVIECPWEAELFETPVLAIISELYSNEKGKLTNLIDIFNDKLDYLKNNASQGFQFTDFGTRRRFSFQAQKGILLYLNAFEPKVLLGTSNAFLAKELHIPAIGTQGHKYYQAHQQLVENLETFQQEALWNWLKEYNGKLGIALSDTVGFDAFLQDFTPALAELYDGCRHDSGDPYTWGHKLIDYYTRHTIDPITKTAVFSDGLTIEKAIELYDYFNSMIKVAFGIGTSLTNDAGFEPLQIVIKMVECNGKPVAKISDSKGKGMCEDKTFLNILKKKFNIS